MGWWCVWQQSEGSRFGNVEVCREAVARFVVDVASAGLAGAGGFLQSFILLLGGFVEVVVDGQNVLTLLGPADFDGSGQAGQLART